MRRRFSGVVWAAAVSALLAGSVVAIHAADDPDRSLRPQADGGAHEQGGLRIKVHVLDDWIEGTFEAGWPVLIEVRESDDLTVKGVAELETGYPPWFFGEAGFSTRIGEPWVPERPDIAVGDWVHVWIDPPGETAQVRVGDIEGVVDLDSDTVSGTVTAPWLAGPVDGECGILVDTGAPSVTFQVDPNGGSYLCDFGAVSWDLQPTDQIVVGYLQPDQHTVINQFLDPGPQLGIAKTGLSIPTPGGHFEYIITYWNTGEAASQLTVLTDDLPAGTGYLASTLDIEPVVNGLTLQFDLGDVGPRTLVDFSIFVDVSAPVPSSIYNEVLLQAPATTGMATGWSVTVQPNDTDLTIASTASEPQPPPDTDLVWLVEVCNVGATSSAAVEVTVMVPSVTPPFGWWADQAGWEEIALTPEQVVVERPTDPGGMCLGLHVLTHVPGTANPGQQLCSIVGVESINDLDPTNNVHEACVTVGGAAPGIAIEKSTNGWDADDPPGPVIPVGEPVEWVYEVTNTGNVPLGGVVVEDDQPGVIPVCPSDELGPGEVMACSANGLAVDGQYANLGTVTATPQVGGDPVTASDPSHYLGELAAVIFEDGFESGDTTAWSATIP
jgi:uncharacterized repeat protein (TIGR01451 family)